MKTTIGKRYRNTTETFTVEKSTGRRTYSLRLYDTDIITIDWLPGHAIEMTVDHGGHLTDTTKRRLNEFFEQVGLPYHLHQKNFDWYWHDGSLADLPERRTYQVVETAAFKTMARFLLSSDIDIEVESSI
jgi:hypothetical protein